MAAAEWGFFSCRRSCMATGGSGQLLINCLLLDICLKQVLLNGVHSWGLGWACAHVHILHHCGYSRLWWVEHRYSGGRCEGKRSFILKSGRMAKVRE